MKIDWMLTALAVGVGVAAIATWRAQRSATTQFNILDLITEGGRISKISVCFMTAFAVSTWIIVDQQIKGTLTEGIFGLWLGAWVGPLVVKVLASKQDTPLASTTVTTVTQQTTETTP